MHWYRYEDWQVQIWASFFAYVLLSMKSIYLTLFKHWIHNACMGSNSSLELARYIIDDIGKKYRTDNLLMPTSIHFEGLFTPNKVEHENDIAYSLAANDFNLVLSTECRQISKVSFHFYVRILGVLTMSKSSTFFASRRFESCTINMHLVYTITWALIHFNVNRKKRGKKHNTLHWIWMVPCTGLLFVRLTTSKSRNANEKSRFLSPFASNSILCVSYLLQLQCFFPEWSGSVYFLCWREQIQNAYKLGDRSAS